MYYFNFAEQVYLKQTEPISTLKTGICRKYFVQKLTCFSELNNGLDAPASNTDDFLSGDTHVFSTQLNRCTGKREPISSFNNLSCRRYSFQKLTHFSQGNNVPDALLLTQLVFF
jgi:hypothetical protein